MFRKRKDKTDKVVNVPKMIVTEANAEEAEPGAALIAAIAAAVASYMGTSANGIVIRSLRRSKPNIPKWGMAGRENQIYHQF
jgi:hypothetical protein